MTTYKTAGIGKMRERLLLQTEQPLVIGLASLTWAAGLVSAVSGRAHGYVTGDVVAITGALPSGYTGRVPVTVTSATAFTYPASGPLTTPATGPITATYTGDTHGGRAGLAWRTLTTIAAEFVPVSPFERLQRQAVEDGLICQFRVRARADLVAGLRAIWAAHWPPGVPVRTFKVTGVDPDDTRRAYMVLGCTEVTLNG